MSEQKFETISRSQLEQRLSEEPPNNDNPSKGYALVNVLSRDNFEEQHIPDSINIPKDAEEEFEKRFDKDKELILYCASPECDASPTVAERLVERGFSHVYDYERGLKDWRGAGLPIEGSRAS